MAVMHNGVVQWCFTVIYACSVLAQREELWSYLESLGTKIGIPWLFLGDFSQVIY